MSLEYNKRMIPRAKQLRRLMTRQERRLWYGFLCDYPVRFQRQKTIGNYIADFYCHEALLVIELDGVQHYNEYGAGYDRARTAFLQSAKIEVLRIPNAGIDEDFAGTRAMIDRAVKLRKGKASQFIRKGTVIAKLEASAEEE